MLLAKKANKKKGVFMVLLGNHGKGKLKLCKTGGVRGSSDVTIFSVYTACGVRDDSVGVVVDEHISS